MRIILFSSFMRHWGTLCLRMHVLTPVFVYAGVCFDSMSWTEWFLWSLSVWGILWFCNCVWVLGWKPRLCTHSHSLHCVYTKPCYEHKSSLTMHTEVMRTSMVKFLCMKHIFSGADSKDKLSSRPSHSKHRSHLLIFAHSSVDVGTNPTNAFLQWMKEKCTADIAEGSSLGCVQ